VEEVALKVEKMKKLANFGGSQVATGKIGKSFAFTIRAI